jgi:hypothetical protein
MKFVTKSASLDGMNRVSGDVWSISVHLFEAVAMLQAFDCFKRLRNFLFFLIEDYLRCLMKLTRKTFVER